MQSTKIATTIAKLNWEGPNERPATRITLVWTTIIAKPTSAAIAA